ncbi:MAG: NADH-quinone oxidoreductase subunit N [Deltaproteobacteria bacterium]|nr:NADH-quinone oxidoreductase subunit N [Deltaproteobacteria bacterium]MBW2051406.1 NADH-quinone oxidoreductase subunit N [Deltaproteobacteria bacterium]MBW2140042.1 NADH-quinone oxidoreductase subunit N [Deltaproteobacteria bacterium]MBW2321921.1 NADH-quinone oxidoreductase subunit N [Deltaproteobacteria bacterium]
MLNQVILFLPELFFLFMALVLFGLTVASGEPKPRRDYHTALVLSAIGAVITLGSIGAEGHLFFKAYRLDLFSQLFKCFLGFGLFLVICISSKLDGIAERHHPEFYLFLTTSTLGMMLLVSAVELITLFVALELSSYSLYILVPMRKGSDHDSEAGIKFFFIGAMASATMLFGMSYIYGVCHTTYLAEIMTTLPQLIHTPGAVVGMVLTLCGLFFKLAVFPFHNWAPDVYEGGANQVVAFVATVSKMAGMAILIRLVALTGGDSTYLMNVLIILAIVGMTLGNLVAIKQKDFKRLLAYSSIAHAGYVLLGILSMSEIGYASVIYYALAYLILNVACFMVLVTMSEKGQNVKIDDFSGLYKRAPLLAVTLLLGVFGLAGLPPTGGFTGKFLIFIAAIEKGYLWLVIFAMVNVTISLYYYIGVVKAAYLNPPAEGSEPIRISIPLRLLNYALIIVILWLGLYPSTLFDQAKIAAEAVLAVL